MSVELDEPQGNLPRLTVIDIEQCQSEYGPAKTWIAVPHGVTLGGLIVQKA